ncbi:MAG TPA: hypothetical protein VNL77_17055 [Roseiflexaceae bacterium]|nr:hypothetical protein [Roseiflexaceae bacterium]
MHRTFNRHWLIASFLVAALLFFAGLAPRQALADDSNRQPWAPVSGTCALAAQGAIFAIDVANCGGSGTPFDANYVFPPMVLRDTASAATPCENGRESGTCFRMWYVGADGSETYRIGYAVSPDGVTWTHVPGGGTNGSVFEASGASGTFDELGVLTLSVLRDGDTFHMWYTGIGGSGQVEGIGYATSADGKTWTRVNGSAGSFPSGNANAVLVERGGTGDFDRIRVQAPYVIIDRASPAAPCGAVPEGERCFRMWYEGLGDFFSIGYAVSPDGIAWTRVLSDDAGGAVLSRGPSSTFDENAVLKPAVIKDGAFYRMWYEGTDFSSGLVKFGHVVSTDGKNWVRPTPNAPVYTGAADAISFPPDNDSVWVARPLKLGAAYELRYATSTPPNSKRFGLARMTPGAQLSSLAVEKSGASYTVRFTTAVTIPVNGSVLLTLPPSVPFNQVAAGTVEGFGPGATLVADPAAVTDAASMGVARDALLLRLSEEAAPGPKALSFTYGGAAPDDLLVQTFDTREVLEYGQVLQTDLQISVTDGRSNQVAGTSVSYTITASNLGPNAANGATVTNTLPAALTGVSWTCTAQGGATCPASGSGALNATVNLPVGGQVTFTVTGTLARSASGSLVHTARIAGTFDGNPANNSATDTDTITPVANLAITKVVAPNPPVPGMTATYTIVASNSGPAAVTGAQVVDTFPASLSGVSWTCTAQGGATCPASGSGTINATVNLPAGGQVTFVATGAVAPGATGTLANTATIAAPASVVDDAPGNNSATSSAALAPRADLAVTNLEYESSGAPGAAIRYIMTVRNNGPSSAPHALTTLAPPNGVQITGWTCSAGLGAQCDAGSGSGDLSATVDLPPGGEATFEVSGTIESSGASIANTTATIAAASGTTDPDQNNNSRSQATKREHQIYVPRVTR